MTQKLRVALRDLESQLKEFHRLQAWEPLGYDSFLAWWDAEFFDVPVSMGIRNWAITKMHSEAPRSKLTGRVASGYNQAIAQAVGTTGKGVTNVIQRTQARHRRLKYGLNDEDAATLAVVVPYRWHRRIMALAIEKDCNMADLVRPVIAAGFKTRYGVDLDAPEEPKPDRSSRSSRTR